MCFNVPDPECCSCGNCLIPLSWTGPDLLHWPRDVVGVIKTWPPKVRASFLLCQFPRHVPKIWKSKPSLMWKRKNRKAFHFLTHNILCLLQEKGGSSDCVIIPRDGLRSRECTVRLWLWPLWAVENAAQKSCLWEQLGQVTKASSYPSSCVSPGQKGTRQFIDGIWITTKPYGSRRDGAQLMSLEVCMGQREGRQRLPHLSTTAPPW